MGIYDVRMVQFVLKIKKMSHTIGGARGSQDLRSSSLIMAPARELLGCSFTNNELEIFNAALGGLLWY